MHTLRARRFVTPSYLRSRLQSARGNLTKVVLLLCLVAVRALATQAEKVGNMFRIPDVLTALQQHTNAERIIRLFPAQGERLGDGYNIPAPEAGVKGVIVNLQRGTHLLSASPESVEFSFTEAQAKTPAELAPFCKEWRELPSQRSKPWFYVCRLHAPGKVPIAVYASLTGDIHGANARVLELRLQTDI